MFLRRVVARGGYMAEYLDHRGGSGSCVIIHEGAKQPQTSGLGRLYNEPKCSCLLLGVQPWCWENTEMGVPYESIGHTHAVQGALLTGAKGGRLGGNKFFFFRRRIREDFTEEVAARGLARPLLKSPWFFRFLLVLQGSAQQGAQALENESIGTKGRLGPLLITLSEIKRTGDMEVNVCQLPP